MAGKSNSFENSLQLLMFNNTNAANIGDATGLRGSSTAGSFYFSLHTADPGEAGTQSTSEIAYTSYARVAVARSNAGFTITNNEVVNAANVSFPAPTGANSTALFWGLGTASSGAGVLLYSGPLATAPIGFAIGNVDDTITIKAHALGVDDRVQFNALAGLALPTGITEGTVYFVKTVPSADTITIAATSGGTTIDITAAGNMIAYKVLPYLTTTGVAPVFSAGAWKIAED